MPRTILAMAALGNLLELLDGAADSWRTCHGRFREWRDQRLIDLAFENEIDRWDRRGGGRSVRLVAVAPSAPGGASMSEASESTGRFWAEKPRRLRVEREPSAESRPVLLVVDGDQWWSYEPR